MNLLHVIIQSMIIYPIATRDYVSELKEKPSKNRGGENV